MNIGLIILIAAVVVFVIMAVWAFLIRSGKPQGYKLHKQETFGTRIIEIYSDVPTALTMKEINDSTEAMLEAAKGMFKDGDYKKIEKRFSHVAVAVSEADQFLQRSGALTPLTKAVYGQYKDKLWNEPVPFPVMNGVFLEGTEREHFVKTGQPLIHEFVHGVSGAVYGAYDPLHQYGALWNGTDSLDYQATLAYTKKA